MFDKLRNAISSATKSFGQKELKEKDIDEGLSELEIALMESDVATEVIDSLKSDLKQKLVGATVEKDQIANTIKQSLQQNISNLFDQAGQIDLLAEINKKKETGEPYIISFMGINGTGKTTTVAKVAYLLKENKFSVVIAAADTYRAGAIEQLSEHAKRLNLKIISQNYGSDPAAVARDAVLYAKSHKIDCILIDTAGRMQTSKNLMDQISKINKVVNPHLKLFVGDSLAGNDTVNQAREFHQYTKFDGAILTKSDADARGGAAISIVKVTSSPILYLGVGQEYKDLKIFDKEFFLGTIFGTEEFVTKPEAIVQQTPKIPKSEEKIEQIQPELKQQIFGSSEKIDPVKPEPTPVSKPESKPEQPKPIEKTISVKTETVPVEKDEDPFAGIATKDIEKYSEIFDVPSPENDKEALELADKIKKWISKERPKDEESTEEQEVLESEDVKPKKKHSLFGWGRK